MKNLKLPSLASIVIFLIPAIQLGYSYYFSISFILFVFSLIVSIKYLDKKLYLILTTISILFLLKSLINSIETSDSREILLPIRELTCFLALIFISLHIEYEKIVIKFINRIILSIMILILILVLYQTYTISTGQYFGIPINYFTNNQSTLIGVDEALFYQTRFRPTSFFGEPSYTAFIILSLLVVCYKTLTTPKSKIFYTFIALTVVAISQSLAGVLSIFLVFSFWIIFSNSYGVRLKTKLLLFVFFIILFLILLNIDEEIFSRIGDIFIGQDSSSNKRFSEPLSLLINVISTGFIFGVNFQYIENYLGYTSLDNALLRMLIYYGILILFPLIILFVYARNGLLIFYIIIVMNFNGEFFSYDKVLVVGMVIGLSKSRFLSLTNYDRHSSTLQSNR